MIWFRIKEGSFGFIIKGRFLQIKAPWSFVFFSERYQYRNANLKIFGWRIFWSRISKP